MYYNSPYSDPPNGVITLSLQWANKHPSQQTILLQTEPDGKLNSSHLVIGWNLELCGLKGYPLTERQKVPGGSCKEKFVSFLQSSNHASLYNSSETEVLKWHINWTRIQNNVAEEDQFQAIQDERNTIPMQYITQYLNNLASLSYTIVAAPTVVASEQMSVWTLSYHHVNTQTETLPQLVHVVNF